GAQRSSLWRGTSENLDQSYLYQRRDRGLRLDDARAAARGSMLCRGRPRRRSGGRRAQRLSVGKIGLAEAEPMKKAQAKKAKKAKNVKTKNVKAKNVRKTDLGAIFDAHVRHEFVDHDVAATMKTMAAEPYVHNVPTLTGGDGHAGVVDFYTHHFVGKMPADTRIERISRT